MKLFDLFDYYDAEKNGVPKLNAAPIDTQAVLESVQAKSGVKLHPKKRTRMPMTKWVAGIMAAAVLIVGGSTVAAAANYGGLDNFFRSLFAVGTPSDPTVLESVVTVPDVAFDSTNESVGWELLGMYGDDAYAMLSFAITVPDGADLPDKLYTMAEITVTGTDGGNVYTSDAAGEMTELKRSDEDDCTYYCNLSLMHADLRGASMDVTFQNFYTEKQFASVQDAYADWEDNLQKQYAMEQLGVTEEEWDSLEDGALPDSFDLGAWKAYLQLQNTAEQLEQCLSESEKAAVGDWHTAVSLDFATPAEPISASYADGAVELHSMSARITYPAEWEDEEDYVIFLLTLKDGQKVCSQFFTKRDEWWQEYINNGEIESIQNDTTDMYIPISDFYSNNGESSGDITICYTEPIAPEEIAEVRVVHMQMDWNRPSSTAGYYSAGEEVLYTAE